MRFKPGGCTPEMANRIVDLLLKDPNSARGSLVIQPRPTAKRKVEKPRCPDVKPAISPQLLRRLPAEEADRLVNLALQVRSTCVIRYGALRAADAALGLPEGTIGNAARLEPERIASQERILRKVAALLEVQT